MTVATCLIPLLKILLHSVGHVCMCAQSLQSGPTLCDPMDSSPLGASVPGILQARLLEWVVMPSSREPSPPRDRIRVSCIAGRFFTAEPLWEPLLATGAIKPYMRDPGGLLGPCLCL